MPNVPVRITNTSVGLAVLIDFTLITDATIYQLQPIQQTEYALELKFNKGIDVSSSLVALVFNRLNLRVPTRLAVRDCSAKAMQNVQLTLSAIRKRQKAEVVANA